MFVHNAPIIHTPIVSHLVYHPQIQLWNLILCFKTDQKLKMVPTVKPITRLQNGYSRTNGWCDIASQGKNRETVIHAHNCRQFELSIKNVADCWRIRRTLVDAGRTCKTSGPRIEPTTFLHCTLHHHHLLFGALADFELNFIGRIAGSNVVVKLLSLCTPLPLPPPICLLYTLFNITLMEWDAW